MATVETGTEIRPFQLDIPEEALEDLRRRIQGGEPSGNLTRDHILDNVTLYWLTGAGASAARS